MGKEYTVYYSYDKSKCLGKLPAVADRGLPNKESVLLVPPGYAKGVPIGVDSVKKGHPYEVEGGMSPPDEAGNSVLEI